MNSSHRESVSFTDVAATFSEGEWNILSDWQRELYGTVMRQIHSVLMDLGYHIHNSEILFRITKNEEPGRYHRYVAARSKEGHAPDILLRINYIGERAVSSDTDDSNEGSEMGQNAAERQSDCLLRVKQEEEEQYCPNPYDSQLDSQAETPPISQEEEEGKPFPSPGRSNEWSPARVLPRSERSSVGEGMEPRRERTQRRKGIARQNKPGLALHNSDKETEPKDSDAPPTAEHFPESGLSNMRLPFPDAQQGAEEACPYTAFPDDAAPISFQQRGQTFIICCVCGKTFCNKSSFQVHMRTHTGERPYKCSDCDKSFIRSSHLKIHLRTHTGERPYKCSECDKSFRDNSSFARHQRIHTGEKPYQCPTCAKYFRKKSNLKDHQRTHTGERPYKCKHCEKSFHQKSNLRVHERNHHGEDC
uniref:Uncharacterized protein n=1 Tax=Xenopus tropicalis TaxID=8364 RepID=A0A7D9NKW1_XENTR|eukprot:XP_017946107.1 PREDICTED: zinc finger protein 182-like [Xenopus tropicalis]